MPNSKSLEQLRVAVEQEKRNVLLRAQRYQHLSEAIAAYQNGSGPAPTVEEFIEWREDVARAMRLREIEQG